MADDHEETRQRDSPTDKPSFSDRMHQHLTDLKAAVDRALADTRRPAPRRARASRSGATSAGRVEARRREADQANARMRAALDAKKAEADTAVAEWKAKRTSSASSIGPRRRRLRERRGRGRLVSVRGGQRGHAGRRGRARDADAARGNQPPQCANRQAPSRRSTGSPTRCSGSDCWASPGRRPGPHRGCARSAAAGPCSDPGLAGGGDGQRSPQTQQSAAETWPRA